MELKNRQILCTSCSSENQLLITAVKSEQQNDHPRMSSMRLLASLLALCITLLMPSEVQAKTLEIVIYSISEVGVGESIGAVLASDSKNGLVITPSLTNLSEGEHGFHLHAGSPCLAEFNQEKISIPGLAAKGHWDPDNTNTHSGPFDDGHRGDLSRLIVNSDGRTTNEVVAPRLSTADLRGRALIVHAGGDTYSDVPPLGGGGARIACGIAG